ncbi:hypothetical protein ABKA04_005311 [Annulohypoxylon sp. FPYF3050]
MTYSRNGIVSAVFKLYEEVIRHPYLDEDVLILPPPNGWDTISIEGKNEAVLDLLRHLPYLHIEDPYKQLLIHWETIPICHCDPENYNMAEETYPLPAHCVYLTRSLDREGTALILDTNEGTITEYTHVGTNIVLPYEEYEALPSPEKWKAHRTTPATELLDTWRRKYEKLVWTVLPNPIGQPQTGRFYSRARSKFEEDRLLQQELLEPCHLQDDDPAKHAGDVYNTYLRHGWPDHFDKERCRMELLRLEKSWDEDQRRRMDEMNPDAGLFN